ncbi:MAG: hypothetical protein HY666_05660 [Chloroflexi bacterium]|nr:hypothetical protein [Chloroflexota bacterium]
MKGILIIGWLIFLVIMLGACSADKPDLQTSAEVLSRDVSQTSDLTGILATTDLSVGTQRVSFLLTSPSGLIKVPQLEVSAVFYPDDSSSGSTRATNRALFYLWPYATRGTYVTQLSLDQPGDWELTIEVPREEGAVGRTSIPLRVRERSVTPPIGSRVPLSKNKTLHDVANLRELSSASSPDPDMYRLTIAEAVESRKPLMVVFSSPAFCTTPTCGPQLEEVQSLKDRYRDRASFIHVEVYDNVEEVQERGLGSGRYAKSVLDWHLPDIESYLNESWVFVVDANGRLAAKFQGFAAAKELEEALDEVLSSPSAKSASMLQGREQPWSNPWQKQAG